MGAYPPSCAEAVARIRSLAERLRDPARRSGARRELRELADQSLDRSPGDPLRTTFIDACIGARQERIELLLLPSIFAPEAWAFTFLEGLFKIPLEEYAGKCLVELGTGSGWVCIALARLTDLAEIWGVDLNPHAAPLAECNAWLNGIDASERLRFATSDLFDRVPTDLRFDFVIGCIPQVLRTEALAPAGDDDRALYDLSNYCAIQHVYEDHFGLGLIARLLDLVPERLASDGRVLLNLAGRPGHAIIGHMFSRRGFHTQVTFARRVPQAEDTDIGPLVELEGRTGRAFEFFLDAHSAEPICAATAEGWLHAGHAIWHEVGVWEGRLALPRETRRLRRALGALSMDPLLAQLDLGGATAERLEFVTGLASRLRERPHLRYAEIAGDRGLRADVARYLERFFGLNLRPVELFVAPEREQAVYSLLLATCDPGDRILVSHNLHATFARAFEKARVTAVVGNDTLHELERLLASFDVKLVLLAVEPDERSNLADLRAIVETAARRGIWVVLDESAHLNITSGVEPHTLFEFLAREPVQPNLVVLYGLIKNAVFPDFELTLVLPVPDTLRTALEAAAELTYSRIGTLPQLFYQQLFTELLSFRVSFSQPEQPTPRPKPAVPLPCSERIRTWLDFPALAPPVFDASDPELIRLDYGENEAPVPRLLIEGLIPGCLAPPEESPLLRLQAAVAAFLLETRGTRRTPEEIVLAQGVWPLLHDLAHALGRRLGRPPRFALVTPCYGLLAPTLAAAGARLELCTLEQLLAAAPGEPPDAVVLCQPQNPLGTYHSRETLLELARYTVEHRCWLVSDEVFGLLNLTDASAETVPSPVALESAVPGVSERTLLLGGVSKEFAAGGLRVGWLATGDAELAQELRATALGRVHAASAHAAAHLYEAYARTRAGKLAHPERHRSLRAYLTELRRDLARKRTRLEAVLPAPREASQSTLGGLFVAPQVDAWLGTCIDGVELTPESLPSVLYQHTHVIVNGGPWCSDPSRIRVVFSVPEEELERAIARIQRFIAEWIPHAMKGSGTETH